MADSVADRRRKFYLNEKDHDERRANRHQRGKATKQDRRRVRQLLASVTLPNAKVG